VEEVALSQEKLYDERGVHELGVGLLEEEEVDHPQEAVEGHPREAAGDRLQEGVEDRPQELEEVHQRLEVEEELHRLQMEEVEEEYRRQWEVEEGERPLLYPQGVVGGSPDF
jgi:hypothetical protein